MICLPVSIVSQVLIDLSNTAQLDNVPRWLPLKEQSETIEHSRAHHAAQGPSVPGSGQGHGQGHGYMPGLGPGQGFGPGQAPGQGDGCQDSPKNSVIKSRSHGIFPDPAKGTPMLQSDMYSIIGLNHVIFSRFPIFKKPKCPQSVAIEILAATMEINTPNSF